MKENFKSRTHIMKDLRQLGISSVPGFGRYNYSHAMPTLESHRHREAFEICYLIRGRQTYQVDNERFNLRGGDIFLTFPNEEHGTNGEPQEKGLLYWVILSKSEDGRFLELPAAQSEALWAALTRFKYRHFRGHPKMQGHLDAIASLSQQHDSPLLRMALNNHLVALLLTVLAAHESATHFKKLQRFEAVTDWIASHIDAPDDLTIEVLAKIAGLSPSRFQAAFKQETGVPPAEFALRARIDEAARRLAQPGAEVTSVAFSLGFSSSQYFASAFRRFTNKVPSEMLVKGLKR